MEKNVVKKRITHLFGLCAIALFSMFMFSACIFTLDTPKIALKGGVLSWEAVASASGYSVSFEKDGNEQIVQTKNTKINIANYMSEVGEYTIKVKATTNSLIWNNSSYSTEIKKSNDGNIEKPKEFKLSTMSNQVSVSFENVFMADTYTIKIVWIDPDDEEEYNPIEFDLVEVEAVEDRVTYVVDLTSHLTEIGKYRFYIKANKIEADNNLSSSEYVEVLNHKSYAKDTLLEDPSLAVTLSAEGEFNKLELRDDGNIDIVDDVRYDEKIRYTSDSLEITLTEVANAAKYIVSLYGSDKTFESTTNVVTIPKSQLPKITTNAELDKTAIQIIHAQVKSNSLYYNASAYSEGYIYLNVPFNKTELNKLKIANPYYSFVGDETFDLCVDSQSELNTLVYFAMVNRISKVHFIQTMDDSLTNEELSEYMREAKSSYYETQNLKSLTVSDKTAVGLILYIENMVSGSPTETAIEGKDGYNLNTKTQVEFNVMQNYSSLSKNDNKRYSVDEAEIEAETKVALPILSKLKENKTVNVYTSDQLYLAVQGGNYPIFVGETQAKIIWQKAIDVLVGTDEQLGIIDSTMDDTKKALAIFDWVCYNNTYDSNLASRSNEALVQKFRGFYMEGMFLDNGQAVCDGISKTYSLLCNMAGVKCYKMSGMGTTNEGTERHAWNRVGIYNEDTDDYKYYMVDCTWKDTSLSYNNANLGEAIIHKYFLIKDDGKHEEANPLKIIGDSEFALSDKSYDYYANTTITLNETDYCLLIKESTIQYDIAGYMTTLVSNLNAEYAKNDNTGLNYLEIKICNQYAPFFGNENPNDVTTAIAASGNNLRWICYRVSVDELPTGYTTFFVLHK